jgi:hypothetical protein
VDNQSIDGWPLDEVLLYLARAASRAPRWNLEKSRAPPTTGSEHREWALFHTDLTTHSVQYASPHTATHEHFQVAAATLQVQISPHDRPIFFFLGTAFMQESANPFFWEIK